MTECKWITDENGVKRFTYGDWDIPMSMLTVVG